MRELRPIFTFLAATFFAVDGNWIVAAGFAFVLVLSVDDVRYLFKDRLRPDPVDDEGHAPRQNP